MVKKCPCIATSGGFISGSPSVSIFLIKFSPFLVCSCFAGAMSGLTVGLLSIDMLDLEIKAQIGTDEEKKRVSVLISSELIYLPGQKNHSSS